MVQDPPLKLQVERIIFKTIIHLKIAIFWKVTPCNLVELYLMFGMNLVPPAFRKMGGSNFLRIIKMDLWETGCEERK